MERLIVTAERDLEALIYQTVASAVQRALRLLVIREDPKQYYTTAEAMELTGLKRRQLQYLRDIGSLPFVKDGRFILYPADELHRHLDSRRVG